MAQNGLMLPVQSYNLTDANGNVVAQVPASMISQWNAMTQQGQNGGGGAIATFGDALTIGANLLEASELRDLQDDISDARSQQRKARAARKAYLTGSTPGVIDPVKLESLLETCDSADDDVNRAQSRAIGTITDSMYVNIAGAGLRVAGRLEGDSGGGGGGGGLGSLIGGGSGLDLIVAGGFGALIFGALDNNSDSRSGRRRRSGF